MLGEPRLVTIYDVDYKVSDFTQQIQNAYEQWIEHEVFKLVKSSKNKLPREEYNQFLLQHLMDSRNGVFVFCGDMFYWLLKYTDFMTELLFYCVIACQGIERDIVKKWVGEFPDAAVELFNRLMESKKN